MRVAHNEGISLPNISQQKRVQFNSCLKSRPLTRIDKSDCLGLLELVEVNNHFIRVLAAYATDSIPLLRSSLSFRYSTDPQAAIAKELIQPASFSHQFMGSECEISPRISCGQSIMVSPTIGVSR